MSDRRPGVFSRLYNGETSFDFVGRWRRWFILSGLVISIGVASLLTRGLNQGIDFKGGTAWQVEAPDASVGDARDVLRPLGFGNAKIQVLGGDTLRVSADVPEGEEGEEDRAAVRDALSELANGNEVSVNDVGPTWGDDVTRKAVRALVFFFVVIALYISLRFEWKMAVAALAAVVHDILVTVGVYSVTGFEVTPATVVAFLTILGFSIYDTIVVFDKVEENTRGLAASGRLSYADTVNLSMNQVLMRSLNTSLVAILPIMSVLVIGAFVLGATSLQDFGLALLVGLITGAYSSIFIASPLLALVKEREPRYAAIRQRLEARGGGAGAPLTPAAAAVAAGGGAGGSPGGDGPLRPGEGARAPRTGPAPPRSGSRPAPRPRKKGRKR